MPLRPARRAELKKALRCMFGQFGTVIDVVSRRTNKLRGQGWVVFEKQGDAEQALEGMQGFPFFNKPIVSLILT
jgi:RNA recognition motif-containing protein